jgi:hypothetical protein
MSDEVVLYEVLQDNYYSNIYKSMYSSNSEYIFFI